MHDNDLSHGYPNYLDSRTKIGGFKRPKEPTLEPVIVKLINYRVAYLYCMSTYVDTILQVDNSLGPPMIKVGLGRAILLAEGADPLLSG